MTTIVNMPLKKLIFSGLLLLTSTGLLVIPLPTLASGSIGAGGGGISNFGQLYRQGKKIFFSKIACSKAHCPIKRREVNKTRAISLVNSLNTRDEFKDADEESVDDQIIKRLCPGNDAGDCTDKPDEQELVQYYLTRRFKLPKSEE